MHIFKYLVVPGPINTARNDYGAVASLLRVDERTSLDVQPMLHHSTQRRCRIDIANESVAVQGKRYQYLLESQRPKRDDLRPLSALYRIDLHKFQHLKLEGVDLSLRDVGKEGTQILFKLLENIRHVLSAA
jgi:hypothetical protein